MFKKRMYPKFYYNQRILFILLICTVLTFTGSFGVENARADADNPPPILKTKHSPSTISSPKPRTVITQDGEIDDMDSLIRFFYYANEVELEGLIYSSSMFHWKGEDPDAPADIDGIGQGGGGLRDHQSSMVLNRWIRYVW